jgi:hypothetical protein
VTLRHLSPDSKLIETQARGIGQTTTIHRQRWLQGEAIRDLALEAHVTAKNSFTVARSGRTPPPPGPRPQSDRICSLAPPPIPVAPDRLETVNGSPRKKATFPKQWGCPACWLTGDAVLAASLASQAISRSEGDTQLEFFFLPDCITRNGSQCGVCSCGDSHSRVESSPRAPRRRCLTLRPTQLERGRLGASRLDSVCKIPVGPVKRVSITNQLGSRRVGIFIMQRPEPTSAMHSCVSKCRYLQLVRKY